MQVFALFDKVQKLTLLYIIRDAEKCRYDTKKKNQDFFVLLTTFRTFVPKIKKKNKCT